MSLKRLFWLVSIILMSMSLLLTAGLVATQWSAYRRGVESVGLVRDLQSGLQVMELVSVERGPTNGLLGAEHAELPQARAALAKARAATDTAIDHLLSALHENRRADFAPIAATVDAMQLQLLQTRLMIDRLAGMPPSARRSQDISAAVDAMIGLITPALVVTADLSTVALNADPSLRSGLGSARLAASLREYAGQIGSRFTAAIATHRALRPDEVIGIAKLAGRAEQMRSVIDLQLRSYQNDAALQEALNAIDADYFGNGMPMMQHLLEIGLRSGNYPLTTSELAREYVPKMQSILGLRDMLLQHAIDDAHARAQRAQTLLEATVSLAALSLTVFYLLLRTLYRHVVAPVLESARLFVALADGALDTEVPQRGGVTEISKLFQAMQAFRASRIARIALEREREALITQLQNSSETDFLTGLMNRRAFLTHGEANFSLAQRYGSEISVLLMDIDHFKQVNDVYGHQVGDRVLRRVGALLIELHRKVDIVVRYGGEEFLVMLPHTSLEQAATVAEKLRLAIAAMQVIPDAGQKPLHITASIGAAAYVADSSLEALIWRADQALYRAKNGGRNQVRLAQTPPATG